MQLLRWIDRWFRRGRLERAEAEQLRLEKKVAQWTARERRARGDRLLSEALVALDLAEQCFVASGQRAATDGEVVFESDSSDRAYLEGVLDAHRAAALLAEARLLRAELPPVEWGFEEPQVVELQRRVLARLQAAPGVQGVRFGPVVADFGGRPAAFDAIEQIRAVRLRLRPHLARAASESR